MNFQSITDIKNLLTKYHAAPSKTMGQNFLIDKKALDNIITDAQLTKEDTVVEVGPGIGVLTQELAKHAGKVIAIEKDQAMVTILSETLKEYSNITVIHADVLKDNYSLPTTNYKLIANIPYYITSPIIRKFLEEKNQPSQIMLMVQKEVGQRICAKPPAMSILAVSVQFYAKPKIVSYVSKGCFWPVPKIDSAIINIIPQATNKTIDVNLFFALVKAGFSHPRKQLAGNLSKILKKDKETISTWLLKNNIEPQQRAETLSVQDWINLTRSF